jgi:ABC-2 type transport system ATP-binding protein
LQEFSFSRAKDPMSETPALEIEQMEKRYGGFSLRVNVTVRSGEVLGVVGPNGSGKTTLIRCLLGLVKPERGRIRFFGLDLERHEVAIKRRVGFILEGAPLFRRVRAGDVLRFCAGFYPHWDWDMVRSWMHQFQLDGSKEVAELSKGMRAQLGLIVAFGSRPDLLLLDEPTAGLDPGTRRRFVELARGALADFGPAILLTSHIMADVEDLADRIAFLRQGELVLVESKERLCQNWRRIRGRCRARPRLDSNEWVAIEYEAICGEIHLVTSCWQEGLLDRLWEAGVTEVTVQRLSLEEIYSYVMRPPS